MQLFKRRSAVGLVLYRNPGALGGGNCDESFFRSELAYETLLGFDLWAVNGWCQSDVARMMGWSASYTSLVYDGKRVPCLCDALRLAALFGRRVEEYWRPL